MCSLYPEKDIMTILYMGSLGYVKFSILWINFSLKYTNVEKLVLAEFSSINSATANLESLFRIKDFFKFRKRLYYEQSFMRSGTKKVRPTQPVRRKDWLCNFFYISSEIFSKKLNIIWCKWLYFVNKVCTLKNNTKLLVGLLKNISGHFFPTI